MHPHPIGTCFYDLKASKDCCQFARLYKNAWDMANDAPTNDALNPLDLGQLAASSWLHERQICGDFICRFSGPDVEKFWGNQDIQFGSISNFIRPEWLERVKSVFNRMIEERLIFYSFGNLHNPESDYKLERICAPVKTRSGFPGLIGFSQYNPKLWKKVQEKGKVVDKNVSSYFIDPANMKIAASE